MFGNISTDILFLVLAISALAVVYLWSGPKRLSSDEPLAKVHGELWNGGTFPTEFLTEHSVAVPHIDAPEYKTMYDIRIVNMCAMYLPPLSFMWTEKFVVRDEYETFFAEILRLYAETSQGLDRVVVLTSARRGNWEFITYVLCKLLLAGQDAIIQDRSEWNRIYVIVKRGVYKLELSPHTRLRLRALLDRLGCSQRPCVLINSFQIDDGPSYLLIEGLRYSCFFIQVGEPNPLEHRDVVGVSPPTDTLYLSLWKSQEMFATGRHVFDVPEQTCVKIWLAFGPNTDYIRQYNEPLSQVSSFESLVLQGINLVLTEETGVLNPEFRAGQRAYDFIMGSHPDSDPRTRFLTIATRKMAYQIVKTTMKAAKLGSYERAERFHEYVGFSEAASRMVYEGIMHYYFDQGVEVHCHPFDHTVSACTIRIPSNTLRYVYVPYMEEGLQVDTYYVSETGIKDSTFDSFIIQDMAVYLFKAIEQPQQRRSINTSALEALCCKIRSRKKWYFVYVSQGRSVTTVQPFEMNIPHGELGFSSAKSWHARVCQCAMTIQY